MDVAQEKARITNPAHPVFDLKTQSWEKGSKLRPICSVGVSTCGIQAPRVVRPVIA